VIILQKSNQQKQTEIFFNKISKIWNKKAKTTSAYLANDILQRNNYVIKVAKQYLKKNVKTLDVGCGTGDLVIKLFKKGYDSYGLDFASSMIQTAKSNAKKSKVDTTRFYKKSFFEFSSKEKFDLISANGFIEYISENELNIFLKKITNTLKKRGILVFSSRNRLFNIFSFNQYTSNEVRNGSINDLIQECILFNSSKKISDILNSKLIEKSIKKFNYYIKTEINVNKRNQYTPLTILKILKKHGFKILDLIPYHVHTLPPSVSKIYPEINNLTSNYLQETKTANIQLIPQSSSFMISCRKK